ncbi:SEUSS-like 1 [Artemisia annua]|uniref:SEUSS-like 1 n=1 Tax=Artemisia annua TaxID=35608 RepID=A0A2U1NTB5_ARTAN|nr:SEUSS-like 1 [Artemisia annua]
MTTGRSEFSSKMHGSVIFVDQNREEALYFSSHIFGYYHLSSIYIPIEATFEVLPRLNEINFGSGVIDELLFLELPREYIFSSGIIVLEYGQVVQESIYDQLRVVREGQLKIIFTPDLKQDLQTNSNRSRVLSEYVIACSKDDDYIMLQGAKHIDFIVTYHFNDHKYTDEGKAFHYASA